jgi:hypothetical protein
VKLPDGRVVPNASRATIFAAVIRSIARDAPRATLAALVLIVALTVLVTRRVTATLCVLGSVLLATLLTVGGAAWLGSGSNFLNFIAIPLTLGLGVEYAINVFERIRVESGDVAAGVESAGGAVFLCSLCTIIGYAALLVADSPALQSFGKYAIAGELATTSSAGGSCRGAARGAAHREPAARSTRRPRNAAPHPRGAPGEPPARPDGAKPGRICAPRTSTSRAAPASGDRGGAPRVAPAPPAMASVPRTPHRRPAPRTTRERDCRAAAGGATRPRSPSSSRGRGTRRATARGAARSVLGRGALRQPGDDLLDLRVAPGDAVATHACAPAAFRCAFAAAAAACLRSFARW